MEFWQRARTFAEEAAKRSQELTIEAAKKSQDRITAIGSSSARLSDIVSEASRKSKEIAAEASKRADQIRAEALKRADLIKSHIPASASAALSSLADADSDSSAAAEDGELERFGVTEELREFVKGITLNTFRDFPLQDDAEMSDIPAVSNVRQDLTAWQEKHAKLVLLTVKEISKLRYELCPRVMKERKFWRIYFILVNSHVSPYEKRYMEEEAERNSAEQVEHDKMKETSTGGTTSKTAAAGMNQTSKTSSATEQDLDVFLLGDLGDSDDAPEEGDESLDDDFDKI